MTVFRPLTARGRRAGQSGFALIAGLMIWVLLCGVTLIALLNMTMSSSRVAVQQAIDSREVRASDSALDAAVNQIRMDPTATVGQATSADDGSCQTGLGPSGTGLSFDDKVGTSVRVTAECERSPQSVPAPAAGDNVTSRVDLVGPRYRSAADLGDTVKWTTDCVGAPSTNCYPWRLGLGVPNYNANASTINAQTPTLVHTSDPTVSSDAARLEIAGDLNVKQSALPMINPPGRGADTGMTVAGTFRQGSNGLFNGVGGTNNCGILGPSFPWNVEGARIIDSNDPAGSPECGAAVTTQDQGLSAPSIVSSLTTRTAPACPAGGPGTVVAFSPGRYDKVQTAAINDLLGGSCPGRVFWFQTGSASNPTTVSGDYWFDVDDSSNSARERNSLIISDSSVRVIFGQPSGGNTAAAAAAATFPNACDKAVPGVSITLSPRTSLRHKAGRVAVCDKTASNAASTLPPAIYQTAGADGGWSANPDPAQSQLTITRDPGWLSWSGTPSTTGGTSAWVTDGNTATATWGCSVLVYNACASDVTASARGLGSGGTAPAGALADSRVDSLDVIAKAWASTSGGAFTIGRGDDAYTEVRLYSAGSSTPRCGASYPAIPDSQSSTVINTLDYDLFSSQADPISGVTPCRDLKGQITRGELYNSRVDVTYQVYLWAVTIGTVSTTFKIDGIELRAGQDLVPSSATAGSGWSNAENLLTLNGQFGGYSLSGCPIFDSCATATRSVTLSGFDNSESPVVPTGGTLAKAGVVVTGETTNQTFFVGNSFVDLSDKPDVSESSNMRVTVSLAGGGSCVAYWPRIPFWGQSVYLDLLSAPGSCAATLTNVSQLVGASATLEVYIERNEWGAWVNYGTRIDSLKISTVTTGSYSGPQAPNLVTENAGTTTSFNVYGPYSTPLNDLNVQWTGAPPQKADGTTVPVIGGQTVVGAIGSFVADGGEAGVLCCAPTKPAERVVTLHAVVTRADGSTEERGTAVVRIRDVSSTGTSAPGTSVTVEKWTLR